VTETKENIFGAFLLLRDQKNEKNQFYLKKTGHNRKYVFSAHKIFLATT